MKYKITPYHEVLQSSTFLGVIATVFKKYFLFDNIPE